MRLMFAACAAAVLIMPARAAAELRARVFYRDGTAPVLKRIDDRPLRFETVIGVQLLDLSRIRRLSFSAENPEQVVIETVAGDNWIAETDIRRLERRLPLSSRGSGRFAAAYVMFEDGGRPPPQAASESRMVLHDTTVVNIDVSRTLMRLRHSRGDWRMPLGAADAVSFVSEDDEIVAVVWFMDAGLYLRAPTDGRDLRVRDLFGRELSVSPAALKAVRTTRPFAVPGSDAAHAADPSRLWRNRESVRLRERRQERDRTIEAGLSVWTLETAFGDLHFPAPVISGIVNDSRSGRTALHTAAGELFTGRMRSDTIEEWRAGDGPAPARPLTPAAFDRIDYERAELPPPPAGWLAWRLKAGDVFHARLADPVITVSAGRRRGGESLDSAEVSEIMPHEETGEFMAHTATGGVFPLHSRERSIDVVLAVNGMRVALPWDAVESARSRTIPDLPPSTSALTLPWLMRDSVLVKGAEFEMGRLRGEGMPDETPPVAVSVSAFIMDATPVTRAQFAAFVRASAYRTDAERANSRLNWRNPGFPQRDDDPVVFVSWFDAARFCNWRSIEAGLEPCYEFTRREAEVVTRRRNSGFRLPTEAEWEFAARSGGRDLIYPWGDDNAPEFLALAANFNRPSDDQRWPWTTPVKRYPPNRLGLYDMAGNVWEWCEDWYFAQAYQTLFRLQPFNPLVRADQVPGLLRRSMRGGSFRNDADMLRCASRGHGLPSQSAERVGFRTVRNAPDE